MQQRRYLWNIQAAKITAFVKHTLLPAVGRVFPYFDTGFRYQEDFHIRNTFKGEGGKCVFCSLAQQTERLIYQDSEISAFFDLKAIATCHILVVPRRHISNVLDLKPEDSQLVEKMWYTGKRLLAERHPTAEHRFGFHIPPMNSIEHLHMHCIALPFIQPLQYKYNHWLWFMAPEDCLAMLRPSSLA